MGIAGKSRGHAESKQGSAPKNSNKYLEIPIRAFSLPSRTSATYAPNPLRRSAKLSNDSILTLSRLFHCERGGAAGSPGPENSDTERTRFQSLRQLPVSFAKMDTPTCRYSSDLPFQILADASGKTQTQAPRSTRSSSLQVPSFPLTLRSLDSPTSALQARVLPLLLLPGVTS